MNDRLIMRLKGGCFRQLFAGLICSSALLLSGCSGMVAEKPVVEEAVIEKKVEPKVEPTIAGHINEISHALADQLIRNTDIKHFSQTPVAVTSFVNLEDFDETSRVGEIIAQNMVHELQVRGHKVIDFKLMPFIEVTPKGDFVMSRDLEELVTRHKINVVLTGTYVMHNDGVVLNARMIEFESGVVVSSAQASIPGWTVDALDKGLASSSPMADPVGDGHGVSPALGSTMVDDGLATVEPATTEQFSKDLYELDAILFSDTAAPAEVNGAIQPLLAPQHNSAVQSGSNYLCLENGVCFGGNSSGEVQGLASEHAPL